MVSGIVPGLAGDVRHLRPGWRTSRPVTEPIMTDDRADPRPGDFTAQQMLSKPRFKPPDAGKPVCVTGGRMAEYACLVHAVDMHATGVVYYLPVAHIHAHMRYPVLFVAEKHKVATHSLRQAVLHG